jgi:hypothetical protein
MPPLTDCPAIAHIDEMATSIDPASIDPGLAVQAPEEGEGIRGRPDPQLGDLAFEPPKVRAWQTTSPEASCLGASARKRKGPIWERDRDV